MNVDLKISSAIEYINYIGLSSSEITDSQYEIISMIVASEVSINLLHNSTGHCGSNIDTMVTMRRGLIEQYNKRFGKYQEINNHY